MDLGSLTARLGVDTRGLDKAQQRMAGFGSSATATLGKIRSSVFSLQGALLSLGVGLSANKIKQVAAEYQTALNDMSKVTDVSLKKIDKSVKGLSPALGNSTELMKGYYQVISAGVTDPVKALETLTTASKTAKVAHVDQSQTVMALTKLMAGYAGQIKNTAQAADLLLSIEKQGQTQVSELVPVIGSAATMSRTAGLSYEEMGASLSLITQTAGSTAEAVTQLNAVNTALLKPTEQMTKLFEEYGGAVNFIKQQGLEAWLLKLQKASNGSAEAMSELLGGRKEATMGASALLANLEGLRTNVKAIEDGVGGLERAWERLEETFEAVADELHNRITNEMILLGTKALPALTHALEFVNKHFDALMTVLGYVVKLGAVYVFIKLAAAIYALGPALTIAIDRMTILNMALADAAVLAGTLNTAFLLITSFFAGWQIGKYLYKEFERVRVFSVNLTDGIVRGWMWVKNQVTVFVTKLTWEIETQIYNWKFLFSEFITAVAKGLRMMPLFKAHAAEVSKFAAEYTAALGNGPSGLEGRLAEVDKKYTETEKRHTIMIKSMMKDALSYGKAADDAKASLDSLVDAALTDFFSDIKSPDKVEEVKTQEQLDAYQDFLNKLEQMRMGWKDFQLYMLEQEVKAFKAAKIKQSEIDKYVGLKTKKINDMNFHREMDQRQQIASEVAENFRNLSQLYKKDSKERQLLSNIAQAATIAEMALQAKKNLMIAVGAVLTQGTGEPYTAPMRMAAMVGFVTSILGIAGIAFGSGSGGTTAAPATPSSTALGSKEQSQSVSKAWDLLQDTYDMEYRELSKLNDSMKNLNENITGLVTSIVRTGGVGAFASMSTSTMGSAEKMMANVFGGKYEDIVNVFTLGMLPGLAESIGGFVGDIMGSIGSAIFGGDSTTTLNAAGIYYGDASVRGLMAGGRVNSWRWAKYRTDTDGGLLGSDSTSYYNRYTELDAQTQLLFTQVFQNMGQTLVFLAEGLGANVNKALNYVFEGGKINLKGLDAEGINKKLTEYFSTIGDKAVKKLFGGIVSSYQQVGEGLMETATRLVIDKAVVVETLDMTNQAFRGSTKKLIAFSEALIQLAGGLDELQDAASQYYDAFFTDAEKEARLRSQLSGLMEDLGFALPEARDGYRDLIEGLNLNTEAGQSAYVTLLKAAEAADSYYSMVEDSVESFTELKDLLQDINPSGVEFADTLYVIADGMDALTGSMRAYYDKFFNDAEKQAKIMETLMSNLSQYGLNLPGSREGYRTLVESLDLTTTEGQKAFAAMMDMASTADQYYSYLEAQEAQRLAANQAAKNAIRPEDFSTNLDYQRALAAIPTFASGGYFGGGLRVVGENGPELEATGAARIWDSFKTRKMLGADDLIAEVRALRDDVRSGNMTISSVDKKAYDILDKWDNIGLPAEQT